MLVCVCVLDMGVYVPTEAGWRVESVKAGVLGGCEPADVSAGNGMQVLYKTVQAVNH